MKILISLFLILFSVTAIAETLSWEPPTTRVDGTPFDPLTEVDRYELVCQDKVTAIPPTQEQEQTYVFKKHEILPDYGEIGCYLIVVDTGGLQSEPSNTVTIPWEKQKPSTATNVILIVE